MRVITGKYKGRKLNSPENYDIRPTTDKAKEALFSILTAEIYGSRVLDLFAGTGSLGIEALSRGAEYCVFGDSSRTGVGLIKSNLQHCNVEEETKVIAGDFRKTLMNLASRIEDGLEEKFDIILLDPPYNKGMLPEAIRMISEGDILAEDGVIVAEHRKEEELPEEIGRFNKEKERRYGIVKLSIYR
ncbi:MAG: 16S rRNA (guanine(966)-N(2))-methyltransferase RsmD [Bacillota bacterium]|nr:16S rRNA (guanine(966)-N(2))-methyltransferase RsmD [Bacillota bacterium]